MDKGPLREEEQAWNVDKGGPEGGGTSMECGKGGPEGGGTSMECGQGGPEGGGTSMECGQGSPEEGGTSMECGKSLYLFATPPPPPPHTDTPPLKLLKMLPQGPRFQGGRIEVIGEHSAS